MSRDKKDVTGPSVALAALSVRVSPFWRRNQVWFFQLKEQFALTDVTTDTTKFNQVFVGVDEKFLALVADV